MSIGIRRWMNIDSSKFHTEPDLMFSNEQNLVFESQKTILSQLFSFKPFFLNFLWNLFTFYFFLVQFKQRKSWTDVLIKHAELLISWLLANPNLPFVSFCFLNAKTCLSKTCISSRKNVASHFSSNITTSSFPFIAMNYLQTI